MNKAYIISGSLFGDEGKGTFVDYLGNEKQLHQNVRYNGGSQASHTVQIGDSIHKFGQLGSNMFDDRNRTFLSANTVVNPFNIYNEATVLADKINHPHEEILRRMYLDREALVVTPYHKIIGQLKELVNKDNRRGSCGTGVSQTKRLYEENALGIKVKDIENINDETIKKIREIFEYTRLFVEQNISKVDKALIDKTSTKDLLQLIDLSKRDEVIRWYENLMKMNFFRIVSGIKEFNDYGEDILMEGSQGVLIDSIYGIKPNTTLLDTTNHYGIKLANEVGYEAIKIGASRAFSSRHGDGILPTKDECLQIIISDPNQEINYWQGSPIYGWYDAVLMRYSQRVNNNDEIFISGIDQLSSCEVIKICNGYLYKGTIDEEFERTFEYIKESNQIIITEIKSNSDNLKYYLEKSSPIYIEIKGWNCDIRNISRYEDLPKECIKYIELIEKLIKTPIILLGVGPRREDKIRRLVA